METPFAPVSLGCVLIHGGEQPAVLKDVFPIIAGPVAHPIDVTRTPRFPPATRPAIMGELPREGSEPLPMHLFDTHGFTRFGLATGYRCLVATAALALTLARPETAPFAISATVAAALGVEPGTSIDTRRATAWLPSRTYGDVVEVLGLVRAVNELGPVIGGETALRVSLAVASDPDDVIVPVIVTHSVLAGFPRPSVGEQIAALLWMQGRITERIGRSPAEFRSA